MLLYNTISYTKHWQAVKKTLFEQNKAVFCQCFPRHCDSNGIRLFKHRLSVRSHQISKRAELLLRKYECITISSILLFMSVETSDGDPKFLPAMALLVAASVSVLTILVDVPSSSILLSNGNSSLFLNKRLQINVLLAALNGSFCRTSSLSNSVKNKNRAFPFL